MTGALRVLLVEDSPTDAKLVIRELSRPGRKLEARRVEDAVAMRAALTEETWDIVISDWSMPVFSAIEALNVVRELRVDVPFIIVSGTIGEETAVDAMRSGANDFLVKHQLTRLSPAVERELREAESRRKRRQAEQALEDSEARLRRVVDSGIVGVMVVTTGGLFKEANDTFLELIGYAREELLAGKIRTEVITPAEWLDADRFALERLEETGVLPLREKEYIHKDGRRVPVVVGGALLGEDECIGYVADISERKRVEATLRRTEDQLRQSQKMEAIGSLAGGVAHDFNNLLSVIISLSELISRELRPSDPLLEDVEEINKAGRRAADLTRQLLAFSRQQILQPVVMNLNEIVVGLQSMLRRVIGEDIEIRVVIAPDLLDVKVDRSQIEQVILNLVVNARDAMPTGGKLTIETSNAELDESYAGAHVGVVPGPHVMLAVSDTGLGMDETTLARIFEPFFTTKDQGKGTGLGLSTVFGIVKQSGGTVWVYSEPSAGTTFKIYFPVAVEKRQVDEVSSATGDASTLLGSETVLLVEDDTSVRHLTRAILRRYGYHVLEAQSGGDALLICEQHPATIDLLLTDLVMPRMSGRQLAERLFGLRPKMKVLFMSGYARGSIVEHGLLDSTVAFIQKPLTPDALVRKVRQVLDTPLPSGRTAPA